MKRCWRTYRVCQPATGYRAHHHLLSLECDAPGTKIDTCAQSGTLMHFALHMAQEPVIEPPQHASDDQANDDAAILQEPSSRPSNSPRGLHRCHAPLPADGICRLLQSLLGDAQAL